MKKLYSDQRDQMSLGLITYLLITYLLITSKSKIQNFQNFKFQNAKFQNAKFQNSNFKITNFQISFKISKKYWICFSKLFEISGELFAFFGAKYFSNRTFSGGVGQGSVRAVQKHAYFRFSRHMAFCQAGFWISGISGISCILRIFLRRFEIRGSIFLYNTCARARRRKQPRVNSFGKIKIYNFINYEILNEPRR